MDANNLFKVPTVLSVEDSFGKQYKVNESGTSGHVFTSYVFRPGDDFSIKVFLNEYALDGEYEIEWSILGKKIGRGISINYQFSQSDIREQQFITCTVTSTKNTWHKHGTYDHRVNIVIQVAPAE